MLNYLTRRVNPTPYVTLMPVEVLMFGEARILEAFQERPPDLLVLTDQEMGSYGAHYFGQGYAEQLFGWLYSHYHRIGKDPDRPCAGYCAACCLRTAHRSRTRIPARNPTVARRLPTSRLTSGPDAQTLPRAQRPALGLP